MNAKAGLAQVVGIDNPNWKLDECRPYTMYKLPLFLHFPSELIRLDLSKKHVFNAYEWENLSKYFIYSSMAVLYRVVEEGTGAEVEIREEVDLIKAIIAKKVC